MTIEHVAMLRLLSPPEQQRCAIAAVSTIVARMHNALKSSGMHMSWPDMATIMPTKRP